MPYFALCDIFRYLEHFQFQLCRNLQNKNIHSSPNWASHVCELLYPSNEGLSLLHTEGLKEGSKIGLHGRIQLDVTVKLENPGTGLLDLLSVFMLQKREARAFTCQICRYYLIYYESHTSGFLKSLIVFDFKKCYL